MADTRFPPTLVLRSLVQSVTDELERGGSRAFIAVPDECAYAFGEVSPVSVRELAVGLGACGEAYVQADIAVSLICCLEPDHRQDAHVAIDGEYVGVRTFPSRHGWHAAIESYAL